MRVRVPPSISFIDVSFIFFILFPRFRPRFGDDRRKVIFSPMYFQTFRFDSGHRRLSVCVPEWGRQ
nr:MAG TPA: hypothetical protein [Caudoviricetes sp.]